MTALLDTNVLVSAAIATADERRSAVRWAVEVALVQQRRFEHVTSGPMLHELRIALERRADIQESQVHSFVDLLAEHSTVIPIYRLPMGSPDPGDDKVIETALNGNVDFLVSEDADLHDLRSQRSLLKTGIGIRERPIRVVRLDAFVAELAGTPPYSPLVVPLAPRGALASPATLAA